MSDLAKTQAQWTALFDEAGVFFAVLKTYRDHAKKFNLRQLRIQSVLVGDPGGGYLAPLTPTAQGALFTGIQLRSNTSKEGRLYVKLTGPGGSNNQLKLYKAPGTSAGDLVAQTAAVAVPADAVPLVAQNSSGIGGAVNIGSNAAFTADTMWFELFPDWPLRASIFDGSDPDHEVLREAWLDMCRTSELLILQVMAKAESALQTFLRTRWASFMRSAELAPLVAEPQDDQGAISVLYTGLLPDGKRAMADDSVAGAQTVRRRTVVANAAVADARNQGAAVVTTPTLEGWARAGLLTLTCVSATIGSEEFEFVQALDAGGSRSARSNLRIGRTFADPALGIASLLLSRSPSLTAGSTNDFGAGSYLVPAGETASNTNDGVLYAKVISSGGNWYLELYKASTYASNQKVATSAVGAAGATVALTAANSSGLTGVWKIGASPTNGNTGTVDLRTLRTQNANGVPDRFTIDVDVTSYGPLYSAEFQERIAELFDTTINQAAAGAETIKDSAVSAGTFVAYDRRDA